MGPKLFGYSREYVSKIKKFVDICAWRNDPKLTQKENNICIEYYKLHAKKLGMNISHYMQEFT